MQKPDVSCLKPTSDDWHPCYPGGKCLVYIGQARPADDAYFVGVRGADDDMWSCEPKSLLETSIMFMRVTSLDDVTKAQLTKMGFQRT